MANTNPKLELLNEKNSMIAFIDHQPQMSFGVNSHDIQSIRNNTNKGDSFLAHLT